MGRPKKRTPAPTERIVGAHPAPGYVRVIRMPSNGSLDYQIPLTRARQLYDLGKLSFDITNGCYTTYRSEMKNSSGPMIR